MNLNVYKEYRFSHGTLISTHTSDIYQFSISQNDRFYKYMKQHIINEKVSASTNIKIGELTILDLDNTFFSHPIFDLETILLVTDKSNFVSAYALSIPNVRIVPDSTSKREYIHGYWQLTLYDLEIPYPTEFDIEETKND